MGHYAMILDTARLLLFPALMAFAAASDLFTMTISNRVSLALIAGFVALAVLGGMGLHDILLHFGAGAAVLVVAFACFAMGWVGGGDAKVAASVALWFGFDHLLELSALCLAARRGADGAADPVPAMAAAFPACGTGLAEPAARQAERNSLRHRARHRRADRSIRETEWIKAIDLAHLAMR